MLICSTNRYIHFDNYNFKLIKYQRGRMLYLFAISIAIVTTTLKLSQFGFANSKADVAQWENMRRKYRKSVVRTRVGKFWFFAFLPPGFPEYSSIILQDPIKIPGYSYQESWGILEGSCLEIQDVQRWVH